MRFRLPTFHDVIDWMNSAFPLAAHSNAEGDALSGLPEQAVLHPAGCVEIHPVFWFGQAPVRHHLRSREWPIPADRDHRQWRARSALWRPRDRAWSSRDVSPAPASPSLRADFASLGDSLGPPGKENIISHAFTDRTSGHSRDDRRARGQGVSAVHAAGHLLGGLSCFFTALLPSVASAV